MINQLCGEVELVKITLKRTPSKRFNGEFELKETLNWSFSHPSYSYNIVADKNASSKFRLNTGFVQHLLEIWQARLVYIHRGVSRNLWGE